MARKKKELSDEEREELDGYLQTEFDHDIYYDLTDKAYYGCDEKYALEFFRLLYSQIAFVKENKNKPLFIVRHFKKSVPDEWELHYLCEKIDRYFSKAKPKDEQIKVCCLEIRKIAEAYNEKIYDRMYEKQAMEKKVILNELQTKLEILPDLQTRLKFLKIELIEYERDTRQVLQLVELSDENSRYSQLLKEIKKTESLIELEKENQSANQSEQIIRKHKGKILETHKDFTLHRAILLMKHLAPRLTGCDQNKVAEAIAFLTSFSSEGVRKGFSEIKNKFLNQPEAYNKDVKIVCEYLNLIGLTNEVEKLKKDSGVT